MDNIFYSIRNGKNPKYSYYLKSYFLRLLPLKAICRKRLNKILAQADTRYDKNYINDRVNYYNRLIEPVKLPEGSPCLNELKLQKKGKVYYFDSFEYLRYFPENLQWNYCFGDINFMPDTPSIVKSRPIHNQSANAILLNLNKVRHFIFVKDSVFQRLIHIFFRPHKYTHVQCFFTDITINVQIFTHFKNSPECRHLLSELMNSFRYSKMKNR